MNPQTPHSAPIDRREFLIRAAKAGASIAVAGAAGLYFHDKKGPGRSSDDSGLVTIPDFSIAAAGKKMGIVHGQDRVKTVQRALEAVGGIGAFIKSGDRVLLKVNAAFATPPALSATANPDLVTEVARLCLRAGATEVRVTDNPINDPASCFRLSGIAEAAERGGAKLIAPQNSYFRPTTLAGGTRIQQWPFLHKPLDGATKVIGISPVKDHHRSGASMSMKNWYGLLGGRRNVFHQDIHGIITELALLMRPTLVILDGTSTMMTNGPTGGSLDDLKATNTMIVSTDQVAADAYGATLLGKTPGDLPYIGMAAAAGAGTLDYRSLHPTEEEVA